MFNGHLHINASCIIYFADVFQPVTNGTYIWLMIDLENEEEINWIYQELPREDQVKMGLQDTFWNSRYRVVTDKYGVTWELNLSKEQ